EFLNGAPLPVTDVVINPADGAMYFVTGGRRTQSGLYRVTYVGKESTAPSPSPPAPLPSGAEGVHDSPLPPTGKGVHDSPLPSGEMGRGEGGTEARALRHKLEEFHGRQDPKAVETAWPFLGHEDRYIRFAARVAVEHQDPRGWLDRALKERNPTAALNGL